MIIVKRTYPITEIVESNHCYELCLPDFWYPLSKRFGVKPNAGDKLTLATLGDAQGKVRGVAINGVEIWRR